MHALNHVTSATPPETLADPRRRILVTEECEMPEWFSDVLDVHVELDIWRYPSELARELQNFDGLIVRNNTVVDYRLLKRAGERLQVVGRYGVGLENIDIDAATSLGVEIVCPSGANASSVAEYCLAQTLNLIRMLPQADQSTKSGNWNRFSFMGRELSEVTVGIVGYGETGAQFARMLNALGCRVLVATRRPHVVPSWARTLDLDSLLHQSDVVSLHAASNGDTRNMISSRELATMRSGAILINAARGAVLDEDALYAALRSGHIGGAALDVRRDEINHDSRFAEFENVVLSPHIAAFTGAAQRRVSERLAQGIVDLFNGRAAAISA